MRREELELKTVAISFKAAIPVLGKSEAEIEAILVFLKNNGWIYETEKVYLNQEWYRGQNRTGNLGGKSIPMLSEPSRTENPAQNPAQNS